MDKMEKNFELAAWVVLFLSVIYFGGHFIVANATAWDGLDADTGSDISLDTGTRATIESNNVMEPGMDIEVFNYDSNESTDVEVQYTYPDTGGPVQVEVYDYATGEYSVLEMEIK
tara:strand:+ start:2056 stop:2400 length:345 start_codon:yes stop_codon:yes gene_type:complete